MLLDKICNIACNKISFRTESTLHIFKSPAVLCVRTSVEMFLCGLWPSLGISDISETFDPVLLLFVVFSSDF